MYCSIYNSIPFSPHPSIKDAGLDYPARFISYFAQPSSAPPCIGIASQPLIRNVVYENSTQKGSGPFQHDLCANTYTLVYGTLTSIVLRSPPLHHRHPSSLPIDVYCCLCSLQALILLVPNLRRSRCVSLQYSKTPTYSVEADIRESIE